MLCQLFPKHIRHTRRSCIFYSGNIFHIDKIVKIPPKFVMDDTGDTSEITWIKMLEMFKIQRNKKFFHKWILFGVSTSPKFPHSFAGRQSIIQFLSGYHPVSFSLFVSQQFVSAGNFFLTFQVLRYFYCTVHCILLSFFPFSVSHPTHVTSRQFLTNPYLPKKCPSSNDI